VEDYTNLFDGEAAAAASTWDKQIASGRYIRGQVFLSAALKSVPRGGYILDYGCGPGRISALLARNGFCVLGLDPSPGMLAAARQQNLDGLNVEFQGCSFAPEELPPGAFDGVVCSSVIEYAPDPGLFLRSLSAALRPSGVLLISFANSLSVPRVWDPLRVRDSYQAARKHTWSWPRFRELLEANGFTATRPPRYFRTVTDRIALLRLLAGSRFWGGLGLVIATKK
jgi:2-polyprenyl-3-methyl-5-hydroxy-6-metoxy-1,4-benzoquinol methylase